MWVSVRAAVPLWPTRTLQSLCGSPDHRWASAIGWPAPAHRSLNPGRRVGRRLVPAPPAPTRRLPQAEMRLLLLVLSLLAAAPGFSVSVALPGPRRPLLGRRGRRPQRGGSLGSRRGEEAPRCGLAPHGCDHVPRRGTMAGKMGLGGAEPGRSFKKGWDLEAVGPRCPALPSWLRAALSRNGTFPPPSPLGRCRARANAGNPSLGWSSEVEGRARRVLAPAKVAGLHSPFHQRPTVCLGPNPAAPQPDCLHLEVWGALIPPQLGSASRAGLANISF